VGPPSVLARGYAVVKLAGPSTIVGPVGQIGGERLEVRVADRTFGPVPDMGNQPRAIRQASFAGSCASAIGCGRTRPR